LPRKLKVISSGVLQFLEPVIIKPRSRGLTVGQIVEVMNQRCGRATSTGEKGARYAHCMRGEPIVLAGSVARESRGSLTAAAMSGSCSIRRGSFHLSRPIQFDHGHQHIELSHPLGRRNPIRSIGRISVICKPWLQAWLSTTFSPYHAGFRWPFGDRPGDLAPHQTDAGRDRMARLVRI